MGGLPPWGGLPEQRRRLSLEQVLQAVVDTPPGFVPSPATVPPGSAPSGVLVLLYGHEGEPWVVLTRRAWHLRHHAGEVSFPGGRREPGDADLWATALREATEEIGLDPENVSRVGRLDSFVTVGSRSLVCPFVATVEQRPELVPDPVEVDQVLHVRLAELTDPEAWREEVWSLDAAFGGERTMTFFELPGDTVWGATAAVLRRLLSITVMGSTAG
ncbi:MAG: CoA pyrophosphatase [Acidimicrobiaceae bacterium]|nr:CoA pyrophosphatase [Acidimicrobiaceae bacterium]MYE95937.1 CoA pyrophosphatase [Acidimicrobiaceae bacterium]MYI53086.1 CoA pyrophosphatase [Acidimicrobiaceae bacterium]